MDILVLVNGGYDKTDGVRVRALFRDLAIEHKVTFHYRDDSRKASSMIGFCKAALQSSPDIVYVEKMGYAGVAAALVAKALRGSKMILSNGDAVYAFAKSHYSRPKALLMGLMEWTAQKAADAIIAWGFFLKALLERQGYENVFWIPGGVDTLLFRPMDVSELRRQMGLDGVLTVGVVGTISWNRKRRFCYGLEVLEALKLLRNQPVCGIIVGTGDGLPTLKQKANEYGIADKVLFTGWIDHNVLPQYVNLIDVCLSTQSNDLVGQVRITAKVPEYLACGRYIIATDVGGAREFVRDAGYLIPCSGLAEKDYITKVADHLSTIMKNPAILRRGLKGVEIARQYFEYSVLRPRLKEVVDKVSSQKRASIR